jgi:2-desacetyl-2-hydroxyethyl bacteriochlorophyllide A dehydrogenase
MQIFDFDPDADVVLGHEISARVLDVGPGVDGVRLDSVVAAHPVLRLPGRTVGIGYSNQYPGAFAERFVVDAAGLEVVPAGLEPRLAALTEPIAVGLHAVDLSQAATLGSAVVLGCGPVGLAVIAALQLRKVPLIVASDFSATRRAFATRMGAHVVVDAATTDPIEAWRAAGGRGRTTVVDAVGVPGMLDRAVLAAPRRSEILVVGLCMQPDTFRPAIAINKELQFTFALGWSAEEFTASLRAIAEGTVDAASLVTGEVNLNGVAAAFDALSSPEEHVKILVRPNG